MEPEQKNPSSEQQNFEWLHRSEPTHPSESLPPAPQVQVGSHPPDSNDPFAPVVPPVVPADIRVPWGWFDLLLLILIAVLGSFGVGLLVALGAGALGVNMAHLKNSTSEQSLFLIVSQVAISFLLLAYLAAQMRLKFDSPFWRTIGWKPLDTGATPRPAAYFSFVLGGFLFAVFVQLASALVGTKAKLPIEVFFQDRRSALLLMLMGVLVAPVVEETIFRGYLYPVIARTCGVTVGIFTTGILFGLLHAPQLKGGWGQIGLLMVVGIVFTYARAVKGTVLASYLLHVSYNSCLFIEFIISSHGLRQFPGQ
jgi:uncharacterized protein